MPDPGSPRPTVPPAPPTSLHTAPPTAPRLAPVADPSPEVLEIYAKGGLSAPDGAPLNIFTTLAHHPRLLKRWLVFAGHVLSKSTLSPRDRELAILRVGVLCDAPYEFGQHDVIARRCGISEAEIEQVRVGPEHPGWTDVERAVLQAADELHHDSRIGDATWATLVAHYDTEQVLDLIFAIGNYHVVSFALNTLGVQLDAGIPDTLHTGALQPGEAAPDDGTMNGA